MSCIKNYYVLSLSGKLANQIFGYHFNLYFVLCLSQPPCKPQRVPSHLTIKA